MEPSTLPPLLGQIRFWLSLTCCACSSGHSLYMGLSQLHLPDRRPTHLQVNMGPVASPDFASLGSLHTRKRKCVYVCVWVQGGGTGDRQAGISYLSPTGRTDRPLCPLASCSRWEKDYGPLQGHCRPSSAHRNSGPVGSHTDIY